MPVLHYIHPLQLDPEDTTWCGRSARDPATVTTDHQLVTCRTCLRKIGRVCSHPSRDATPEGWMKCGICGDVDDGEE